MNTLHASLAAAVLALAGACHAEGFPSKPLRIVVPNPAGGTVDLIARLAGQGVTDTLGQAVAVEPRPGGNTIIGTEAVARAQADGHTLVMIGTSFAINPLVRKMPYDTYKDFVPVARLAQLPYVLAVHPSVPAQDLRELVALAKARPSQLAYASFGVGQLAGESFKRAAGIDMNFVPYQGGVQATLAVVSGHVGVLMGPLSDAMPHIHAGKLRPLAITSRERAALLPQVPTVTELGYPGFEWTSWIGVAAPAGTPPDAVAKLAASMTRALQRPDATAVLDKLSVSAAPLPPKEFAEFIRVQARSYETIIREANLRVE